MKHFHSPFRAIVSAPSLSGKSTFVMNLIKNKDKLFDGPPIKEIVWCCRRSKFAPPELTHIPNVRIYECMIDLDELKPDTLLVLDDLLDCLSPKISEVFTVHSHHSRISVILIVQNLFHNDKYMRTISLNSNYFILMRNPRHSGQFGCFARQIDSENWRNLQKVYNTVCSRPYVLFIIDLSQNTNDISRYKTNIFNDDFYESYLTSEDISRCCTESFETDDKDKVLVSVLT